MGSVTVITGGKGGTGKTFSAANLGAALAMRGKKTLVIDADTGLRSLDIAMNMEGGIVYDMTDAARGACPEDKAILPCERFDNLFLMPAAQTKDETEVTVTQMKNLLQKLRPRFDFIFIDSPPGVGRGFELAAAGADDAIIVTTPEQCALRDADRVAGLLEKNELTSFKLMINRFRPALARRGLMPDVENILSYLSIDLLGVVPEDENALPGARFLVEDKKSQAAAAFRNMAGRLCGEKIELPDYKEKKHRIFFLNK